jgi:NifU-like protein involved in Fe-S cluster formation
VIDDLYSLRLLALAAEMPHAGRLPRPQASAERVSRLCGSRVIVDVTLADGRVRDFAQDVRACALGQAAAAILGASVIGATVEEIEEGRDALRSVLKGSPSERSSRFADVELLAQVRDYPARHASTLLAFEAAAAAARAAAEGAEAAPQPAVSG